MLFVAGFLLLVALETYVVIRLILRRPVTSGAGSTPDAVPLSTGYPDLDEALEMYRICPSVLHRAEVEFQAECAEGAFTSCLFD